MDSASWRERAGSFGSAALVYDRSRPSYPVDAVRWVLPETPVRVLDLAAGTGKLTGVLLDLGLDVVAVEPDPQMRALLPARAEILAGTAEEIPLPDGSVDAVLVGQAFHWFDRDAALAEVARVLRPGGTLGLLWNLRDSVEPWVEQVWDLVDSEPTDVDADLSLDSFGNVEREQFGYVQQLDPELLVDLAASRSAVLVLPEADRAALLQQVRGLAPSESFELAYRTVAWRATRR